MLTTLDKNQIELMEVVKNEWIDKVIHSGDELDVGKFYKGIDFIYELSNLAKPIKVYVDSPLGLQYACQLLKSYNFKNSSGVRSEVSSQVRSQVSSQIDSQIDSQLNSQVNSQVGLQVESQVSSQVRSQVSSQVSSQLRSQIGLQVRSEVDSQLHSQVSLEIRSLVGLQIYSQVNLQISAQVSSEVRLQVPSEVFSEIRSEVDSQIKSPEYVSYENLGWAAGWASFYDYFQRIGVVKLENLDKYKDFLNSGVFETILFNNFAIGCRRPKEVLRDEENRMHSDLRAAISWRDGYELYYLWGVHFPKELWTQVVAKTMSFADIMAIKDSDQRMCALRMNPEAIIKSGAELVDKSERGNELYKIVKQEINKIVDFPVMWFLRMTCPTGRVFVEGVDPEVATLTPKADACQAYALGLTYEEYTQLKLES